MCFVAGTLVHGATLTDDAVHHRPIETARAGEIVWARNEVTGEVAKKQIVATFVTHPETLHHVNIDRDG